MKKILIILVLVCCINNSYAQNCIQLIENNLDYGETLPNEQLHFNFIFRNQCKDTIRVKNFIAGSKVKFNDFSKMILYPNESDTITISYNSEISSHEEYTNSEMIVFSNDQTFELISKFKTINNTKILFQRKNVNLGQIRVDSNYEYKFTFYNKYSTPVNIVKCTRNNKKFQVNYPSKNILPNHYGELKLKFNTYTKEDSISNTIKIHFSNKDSVELSISSSIFFILGIKNHNFGMKLKNQAHYKKFKFKNLSSDTLIILNIEFEVYKNGVNSNKDTIYPNEEFYITIHYRVEDEIEPELCKIIFNNKKSLILNLSYELKDEDLERYDKYLKERFKKDRPIKLMKYR